MLRRQHASSDRELDLCRRATSLSKCQTEGLRAPGASAESGLKQVTPAKTIQSIDVVE